MPEIRFLANVGSDQLMRPPAGLLLPQGELEVRVRATNGSAETGTDDPLAPTRRWLLAIADEAEAIAPEFPSALAEHHDHHAHGKHRS